MDDDYDHANWRGSASRPAQPQFLGRGLDEGRLEISGAVMIGVGCIGVLVYDSSGQPAAGLSVSAPIERRRDAWAQDLVAAGQAISAELGWRAD